MVVLALLTPACVADGPRTSDTEAPPPRSLLAREAESGGTLVFPPAGRPRLARPELDAAPEDPAREGAPEVTSPALDGATIEMLGGRLRVVFSQPMETPAAPTGHHGKSVPAAPGTLTLTPEVKARVEWLDPYTLELSAEEPLVTGRRYGASLGDVRSRWGKPLASAWRVTVIPRVEVAGKVLGYAPRPGEPRVVAMHPHEGATVGPRPEIAVLYDQPIDLGRAQTLLSMTAEGGRRVPFTASRPPGPTFQGIPVDRRFVVVLQPAAPLERGKKHTLRAEAAVAGGAPSSVGFDVARPLEMTGVECPSWGREGACSAEGGVIETKGDTLVFRTNNPVSMSAKELVKLVRVSPPVRRLWARTAGWESAGVEVEADFERSTRYEVTLVGLTDAYGSQLAAPARTVVERAPDDASITMASGVLLLDPARRKRFELTSRNVAEARLSLWPVDDGGLATAVRTVRNGVLPETAALVQLDVDVAARENELVTTPVDLTDLLKEGRAYVATVSVKSAAFGADEPEVDRGPVALLHPVGPDSLAVHAERSGAGTLVHVARLATGEPVAGATLVAGDAAALPVTSDADGLALLDAKASGLLTVTEGPARAFLDLDAADTGHGKLFPALASGAAIDASAPRALVLTDRGIYRPGATVHLFANVRRAEGARLAPASGMDVVVRALGPSGEEVFRAPLATSELGSVATSFELARTAKLGRHRVVVERASGVDEAAGDDAAGGRAPLAQAIVHVAEFEAPRFAVDVDASGTDRGALRATVAARYLFGAPMDGAPVRWTARREPAPIAHGAFEGMGFSFRRARAAGEAAEAWSRAGEVAAGPDGVARIEQKLSIAGASGPQRFVVEAEVTDASHRAVAGRAAAVVHPAARYAGLRVARRWAAPGERVPVELAVVDREGKAVVGASVSAVLSRVVYTYITRRTAGGAAEDEWTRRTVPAGRCSAKSGASAVTCDLVLPAEGDYEIAAEVDGRPGGAVSAWAWRLGGGQRHATPGRGRAIELVADRATYAPGETARLFVTSPFEAATAIVTTDAPGARPRALRIEGSAGVIEVPVSAEDAPHVHAMVTLLPRSTSGAAPADYRVGAIRLPVAAEGERIALDVRPEKTSYRPGEKVRIDLRATDAGAAVAGAQVAIAVVDEGVLRYSGFHAPDPVTALRPGRALATQVFDTRSALADLVAQSHVAGDGDDGAPSPTGRRGETGRSVTSARRRFAETAYWNPGVVTDAEGRATVEFSLPDNLTEMRVTAVAIDRDGKGAVKETSFEVNKPVLVAPALPRFVTLGDGFEAAALVHNNTDQAAILTVALEGRERRLLVPARGHVRVGFPVRVTCDEPDDADDADDAADEDDADDAAGGREDDEDVVRACPTSAGEGEPPSIRLGLEVRGADGAQLDAVEQTIPATFAALAEAPRVDGAFVKRREVALRVPARVAGRDGRDKLVIALGATLWPELGERLRYLLDYPHGCVEQTTSRTLPLLAARDIAPRIGMAEVKDDDLRAKIRAGIDRLASMRTASGGLAYWPGGGKPNVYGTAYAMRALVLAKAAGIEPLAGLTDGMARYLKEEMLRNRTEPEVRAAIAQSLAELGKLDPSAADALYQSSDTQSVFGAASLALALSALPGQEDRVAALLDQVEAGIDASGELRQPPSAHDFHYYGSPARTKAQAAIALRRLRPGSPALPGLVRSLSGPTDGYTTQATAYSLLALAEEVRVLAAGASDARVRLDGREIMPARELAGGGREFEIPLADVAGKEATLVLESEAAEPVGFAVRAAWRRPVADVAASAFRAERGPALYRAYTDPKGAPVDLSRVRAGDVVRVALVARRPATLDRARYGYVAITDRLPAGFEPVQQDLATVAAQPDVGDAHPFAAWLRYGDERPSFVEMHDDRVDIYFDEASGDDVAATYLMRATTPGRFAIAPATAELMYEPDSLGATEAAEVVVR